MDGGGQGTLLWGEERGGIQNAKPGRFRVQGFRVSGLGFRVLGVSGFRLGFVVSGCTRTLASALEYQALMVLNHEYL